MESMITLAKNIKFYREKNGWTQEELSGHLNISRSNISKWESGDTTPSIIDLLQLSNLFQVTLDQLVGVNIFSQAYILEFKQKYQSFLNEGNEEITDVIDYLIQNPRMVQVLKELSTFKPSDRKKLENVLIYTIQTLSH
ncbi:helix-turn-helix domain-containing protein [Fredinandcohnia quinoae]|uniref:Helix-turn-helix domain-containing protein n=1 Tax=Fredinandcohnia quinoae TaxID=2918902 RepID=A0AAW5E0T0_9BACI|nr:helix-turn-helix transcriptional regulator [Fredinandcohnia sp. SECRCQ15]MCH1625184.1 helix-turn-helix domain-containing protein [Fredinandcohnia sp. SECRCQ15]